MSKNPEIYVFNDDTLLEHNRDLASKVHQLTVASTVRKLNKMNSGQILNASRNNGENLYWSQEKLNKVLSHMDDCKPTP